MVLVNSGREKKEFDFKGLAYPLLRTIALAVAIFIAIWVLNYFAPMKVPVMENLLVFLTNNWYYVVGFVLLVSVWEYVYPLYYKQLKYGAPAIEAISLLFGFWLVAIFLWGMKVFTASSPEVSTMLQFIGDFFFALEIPIFILFLVVTYARFFMKEKEREED